MRMFTTDVEILLLTDLNPACQTKSVRQLADRCHNKSPGQGHFTMTSYEVFIEYEDGSTQIEFQNMTKYEAAMFCYSCNSRINPFTTIWFYSFREQQRDVPVNMRIKTKKQVNHENY